MAARFEGDFLVTLLDDGRDIRLESDLVFYDPQEVRWAVPKGAVVDGASIPKAFWSLVGGPLEGKYRNASIIHDWFCDKRTRTWQATHRVFFDGMIASDVGAVQAKLFYYAVLWGGPRWETRVSINTNLPVDSNFHLRNDTTPPTEKVEMTVVALASPGSAQSAEDQAAVAAQLHAMMAARDISLAEIERLAEQPRPDVMR